MALLHRAQLTPSKIDLLREWIPLQPWYPGGAASDLHAVGSYRFDDPDGEVGIETHLVESGEGTILQVPLTYRSQALEGAGSHLVGTMMHSVLGKRWIYDGCGDPVYATMLTRTILTGGRQADQERDVDGRLEPVEPTATVRGSGSDTEVGSTTLESCEHVGTTTVMSTKPYGLVVRRVLDDADSVESATNLTGTWAGRDTPSLLALVRQG